MASHCLEIVRFRRRYYIYSRYCDPDEFGDELVASIPTDPGQYRRWLQAKRDEYAAKENCLEVEFYEIRDGSKPNYLGLREFGTPPSEFPRLGDVAEFVYLINLDQEILTINHSVHWKLRNIPRQNKLWFRAMVGSIYRGKLTISLDVCPEDHIASPSLGFPRSQQEIEYRSRVVIPKTGLAEARKTFLTHILASTLIEYKNEIIRFGMEWSPDSLPFRDLAFALVSIASGQASFHSFHDAACGPPNGSAPLLEFGSLRHRPHESPGASPTEIMYWLEGVLVSLALVVDGKAITKAMAWGIKQGHTHFQIVILSLFEVSLAEVSHGKDKVPFVKVSNPVSLSPLRPDYCLSTHPRLRPELKAGMESRHRRGEAILNTNCTGTKQRLRTQFLGLAALVNFFEVAGNRRAASRSRGVLHLDVSLVILEFVDYNTWKACLRVSTELRYLCLRKYRVDDRTRIAAGPFVRLERLHHLRLVSFDFENMETGQILPMWWVPDYLWTKEYNWMPIIGCDNRRAVMLDVAIQYEPAEQVPVEADSDDEGV
ncbi:hypothetical protein BJY00DRAFT_326606 [Aspergillus carlsbadensis]|nr:hypothetical protein BJY00DRAFT_326606 [Aspergillus carlsbadensis]